MYHNRFATGVYRAFKLATAHADNGCGRIELGMRLRGGTGQLANLATLIIKTTHPNSGFKPANIGRFIKLVFV